MQTNIQHISNLTYDTVLFDLDGTLLDTLEDMHSSVNHVLRELHFPERTLDEIRRFVGNGIRNLIQRAVPEDTPAEVIENALARYRAYYNDHCLIHTRPYPGIMEMLQSLKQAGCRIAIVSNKNAEATQKIYDHYFTTLTSVAIGQADTIPKKPDPAMVQLAFSRLGGQEQPGRAVYIGDSDVDILTAENSGLDCISCTWGFRSREFLLEHGAKILVNHPQEITDLIVKPIA